MRSLFFKIFIIFWIAQTLIFVISTALILARRFPRPASMLDPAFSSLRAEAAEALQLFDAGGCSGFDSFVQQHRGSFALVEESGRTVCGDSSLSVRDQVPSTTEIYGRQLGQDTVWTLPVVSAKGEQFRFLVSVHREQHTWYGDLAHFAFPQLLVAVAVGGLTTFALVMIFTRPVIHLREAARQLAIGRLDARAKESRKLSALHADEFDALVHDFNHMAERLESLVNAQKMLLRDVSHELRSPLARASVALELARDDADSTMTTHLDRIQRETERLNQLIGQLLTLSSMEANEEEVGFERIVLNKLVEEIVSDANYEAHQRNCSVKFDRGEELEIVGRRELIYRAVENVVRNAIRFTEEGTAVEIRTTAVADGTRKLASVQVSDHGPGIPDKEIESIFRPFYKVDQARSPQKGGFGVGLAIADRSVKLHKGDLRAFNRASGGLTIEMRFPIG
ncbi:MAG: HAMP domain-containing protein [Acidobacteria bacterium]|nr:HAMP domain-containing protein [Acidobacteriota bacterium]